MERSLRRNLSLASLVARRSVPGDFLVWYHTGDDDLDEFLDRNVEWVEIFLGVLGVAFMERAYSKRFGLMPVWHVLAAIGGRVAADYVGYYWSGIIDPDEGHARWNEYHDRAYDWYGLENIEILDASIAVVPNPLQLGGIVAESIVMVGEHLQQTERLAGRILLPYAERALESAWEHLTSPQGFAWGR